MANVNAQITDAVTQANVKVLGDAPAQAMGSLYQATAQTMANAVQNATANQQNVNQLSVAVVTRCIENLVGGAK